MRLTPVSRPDLIKRLRGLGFQGPSPGAKDQHMVKGNVQLTIPNPHGGEIGVNLPNNEQIFDDVLGGEGWED
jgi:hypothetical protein